MKNMRLYHKAHTEPYSVLLDCRSRPDALLFESGVVAQLSDSEVECVRNNGYVKLLDVYGCLGMYLHHVALQDGRSEKIPFLVLITGCASVGKMKDFEVFRLTLVSFFSLRNRCQDETMVVKLKELLSSGLFYFARYATGKNFDLTLCEQRRYQQQVVSDARFFWNANFCHFFRRYNVDPLWVSKLICGGFEVRTIYAGHQQARICLISRLSCERAGTRFNVRGVNDDGQVANFVETEQVIYLEDSVASYIHVRGSVPLFWEQSGLQVILAFFFFIYDDVNSSTFSFCKGNFTKVMRWSRFYTCITF
jgi:synaptojanin